MLLFTFWFQQLQHRRWTFVDASLKQGLVNPGRAQEKLLELGQTLVNRYNQKHECENSKNWAKKFNLLLSAIRNLEQWKKGRRNDLESVGIPLAAFSGLGSAFYNYYTFEIYQKDY